MNVAFSAMLAGVGATGAAVFAGTVAPRRVAPALATRVVAWTAVAAAATFVWMLVLIAGSAVVELHGVAERLTWCGDYVREHSETMTPAGLGAVLVLVGVLVSTCVVRRRQRRLTAPRGDGDLTIVVSEEATAFALPGRPGKVVVSTGLLRALDAPERSVLFAHEQAHLRLGHHRYVRSVQLASAAFPIVRPAVNSVRYWTERWADEEAARVVGDRALVAQAIARAALMSSTETEAGAMGFSGSAVVARVEAMLGEPPRPTRGRDVGLASGVAAAFGGALTGVVLFTHEWLSVLLGYCA